MKLLILCSCILGIAVASPVRPTEHAPATRRTEAHHGPRSQTRIERSASGSSSNEHMLGPMMMGPGMMPGMIPGPFQPPIGQPQVLPQQVPPQGMPVPIYVYYDPAQGSPPVAGPASPILSPFSGYPIYPPVGNPILGPYPGYPVVPPVLGK